VAGLLKCATSRKILDEGETPQGALKLARHCAANIFAWFKAYFDKDFSWELQEQVHRSIIASKTLTDAHNQNLYYGTVLQHQEHGQLEQSIALDQLQYQEHCNFKPLPFFT
jgi:hypothetical protein